MSVASITTAYNAAQRLPRQIEAVLRQTRPLDEIIVVDNCSDDGTRALLAMQYPQVTVLSMAENLGAAGAWAAGLEYAALQMKHDWIWAFDDDSVPEDTALAGLLRAAEAFGKGSGNIAMVAAKLVHPGTGACYPPLLWRDGFVKPAAEIAGQPVWFADLTFTAGAMVRREMVEEIGLPRADFFMDFFDFEYCLRARSRGYQIAVVSAARLDHEVGAARPARLPWLSGLWPNHAPWREYYMSRNLTYAVWRLYPSRRAKRFVIRHLARHAAGIFLFGDEKLASLGKMAQGFWDGKQARLGIRFRPDKITYSRRQPPAERLADGEISPG